MNIDISAHVRGVVIYYSMYVVGFILMLVFNLFKCNVYNITRPRAAVYTVLSGAYGMLGLVVIGDLYNAIAALKFFEARIDLEMIGGVLFLLLFIPPTVYVEKCFRKRKTKPILNIDAKQEKRESISFRDTFDSITPGLIILSVCGKIGCHFAGCCYGIECSWGTHLNGTRLFPIQLCEAATLFLILIANYYIKQSRFYRRGMDTPLVAAMYSFARFCWEFLRGYEKPGLKHFFLGLSLWQIFCIIIFVVVVVWVIVLYKTQPSEPMPKNYLFAKNATRTKKSKVKNIWIQ